MKKFLLVILILFLGFSGFVIYDTYFKNNVKKLQIEEEVINIDELYIYGTHLNMHGNVTDSNNTDLVLYNGEFISVPINISNNNFNISDYVNGGLYLDNIPIGEYYMFLRCTVKDDEGNDIYKYYGLKNSTKYDDTTYYTLSNNNNKITISNEDEYPTMKMSVVNNNNKDIYDIVIDPGHGGRDGGASKYGYSESDFTLDLAIKVKKELEKKDIKVKLTHEAINKDDRLDEYGVHGRAVIPYEVGAKYVFSLHMNSNNDTNVNGIEVYTADNINYDFANNLVNNIINITGLNYSNNKINRVQNGIYTRTFTKSDIEDSIKDYNENDLIPYDITTKSNYYYIIRETGGIVTGAYVDNRNSKIDGNPYCYSNIGSEAYLLELGYISNKSNLDNMLNNMDKYVEAIVNSIVMLTDSNQ